MQKIAPSLTSPWLALAVGVAACASPAAPPPHPNATAVTAPAPATPTSGAVAAHPSHASAPKMAAPISLAIAQRELAAASYELTLTATLSADVDDLSLRLDKKTQTFGAHRKGDVLTMTTTVDVAPGQGMDAIGGATLMLGARKLTAAIAQRVGTPAKQPAATVVDVPGIGQVSGGKQ
ncbi:MAG: hypothetical protein IPL79_11525 [Myxococcales bacterium]|nr:hypothetical protein [Myxococcales bacterium]